MDMKEYTSKMAQADYELPKNLNRMDSKMKLSSYLVKSLRGINGALQWLTTNLRMDLAARVSLSASEIANPTIASLQTANKMIRQAQREENMTVTFQSISLDQLTIGTFCDAA